MPIVDHSREMIIVAHPDDDLLFMNPDLSRSISMGREMAAVFVTAGDAGQSESYWLGREEGIRSAYGDMAGANDWVNTTVSVTHAGQSYQIATSYLASNPDLQLYFLRLPDGGGGGVDGETYNSLTLLVDGAIANVTTADGSAVYDRDDVVSILSGLMEHHNPDQFRVHDYASDYAGAEHRDHISTALLTDMALASYTADLYAVTSYIFYGSVDLRRNLTAAETAEARDTFLQYAARDPNVFDSTGDLINLYSEWVQRQFVANETIVDTLGTASVSGQYFHELRNVGVYEPTDRPVAGAFVHLAEAATGQIVSTTMTDINGGYRFHNLTDGASYRIVFDAPGNLGGGFLSYGFSAANAGGNDQLDSDVIAVTAEGRGQTAAFVATAGNEQSHVDAAIYNANPATISGRYFIDANANGIHNSSEDGIAGASVQLFDTAADQLVAVTQTDANGLYRFDGLTASEGFVVLFEPGDILGGSLEQHGFTAAGATASQAFDSNVTGLSFRGWGETDPIVLGAGDHATHIDAGLRAPTGASIAGRYFVDLDRDGIEQRSEPGVANADVFLFEEGHSSRIAVTTTDDQGRYSFDGLEAANGYRVFFQSPDTLGRMFEDLTITLFDEGEDDRIDSDVTGFAQDGRLRTDQIAITAHQTLTNVDAGVASPPPGTVAGRYFHDATGQGFDTGGAGISGASVWLFQGDTEIAATATNIQGHYRFNDVPVGEDYFVFFESPASLPNAEFVDPTTSALLDPLTADVTGVGLFTTGATSGFEVTSGSYMDGIDAGLSILGDLPDADTAFTF